jgi:16S rRNA (uracil1498-N3)-methyltransferase
MPAHRVFAETPLAVGPLNIGGDEAHHAVRAKRVQAGQVIQVLNGRGHVATGKVAAIEKVRGEWRLVVDVERVETARPSSPRLEVYTATPKGGRLPELVDGLGQVGAASWSPLDTERGEEPTETKVDRLHRIVIETTKQCGRAWHLEIGSAKSFVRAVEGAAGTSLVMADASGAAYGANGAERIRLLIGPEGGWSPRELEQARDARVQVASFGPHIMRIETAAVAAAAIVLDREQTR